MRDEGKAFCSDSWYLLAGVLFQKRQHNLPLKRNSHQAGANGVPHAHSNGHVSLAVNGNGHSSLADGNGNGNGHLAGATGNGHLARATGNGHFHQADGESSSDGDTEIKGLGDCTGLQHRYAAADSSVGFVEDQMDELMKVMTALH